MTHRSVLGFSFAVALASFRVRFSCREAAALGLSATSVRAEAAAARRCPEGVVALEAMTPHRRSLDGNSDPPRSPIESCWRSTDLLVVRADSPYW